MDLFVVKRYLGNEEAVCKNLDEKEKLSLLLSKIKKRKKYKEELGRQYQKEESSDSPLGVSDNVAASSELPVAKKQKGNESAQKKKRKGNRIEGPSSEEDENNVERNVEKKTGEKVKGFTVIGSDRFRKKSKVKRVLPQWLANPSVVQVDLQQLTMAVTAVPALDADIVEALQRSNITHFFPVQAQVIPWLLSVHSKPVQYWLRDVCVSAPTGSGKTLAFVLPIVQMLRRRMVVQVRALVVLPVQDLAVQVHRVFLTYCQHTELRVILLTGQTSFHREQQQLVGSSVTGYRSMVDIVVTTPGRLVDHLHGTPGFTLKHLRFLVIDEADRVLENVQNDWLYHLYSYIEDDSAGCHAPPLTVAMLESASSPRPQKLLFSATLTQDPEKLQQLGLFQPKLFTSVVKDEEIALQGAFTGKYTTPAELTEKVCVVEPELKPLVLYHIISSNSWQHVLVFVGSKKEAHRLSLLLMHLGRDTLKVAEISSDLSRTAREKLLHRFSTGKLNVLVSSDALARGMDIPCVDYVVLYSMPKSIKNYIHRVGRTARAGKPGTAVTLLLETQVAQLNDMLRMAGKAALERLQVEESQLAELGDRYSSALEALRERLKGKT
ncbi:probable ATP-dependent RNA helicase Dbp73D [Periplaneta americana]|uniref:probable ATP-dependent RNA helicase Dbp73D n=1 Tax=Periplaneta americana TaxID=6978 RepID=UPI0037E9C786